MGKKERKAAIKALKESQEAKRKRKKQLKNPENNSSSESEDDTHLRKKKKGSEGLGKPLSPQCAGNTDDAVRRLLLLIEKEKDKGFGNSNRINISCWSGEVPTSEPLEELKIARKVLGIKVRQRNSKSQIEGKVNSETFCPAPFHPSCLSEQDDSSKDSLRKVCSDSEHLPKLFKHFCEKSNLSRPTAIQLQTWPAMLCTKFNILNIAPTGSGKTLAYTLPIVELIRNYLKNQPKVSKKKKSNSKPLLNSSDGPLALIIVPTRELAQQANRTIKSVCRMAQQSSEQHMKKLKIRSMAIYGGVPRNHQVEEFREGGFVHILCATPGRLMDLLADRIFSLRNVSCMVLDECDRMLQLGFIDQINAISSYVRKDRMTCLFSATLPSRLANSCDQWLPDPQIQIRASTSSLKVEDRDAHMSMKKKLSSDIVNIEDDHLEANEKNSFTCYEGDEHRNKLDFAAIPSNIQQILHVCASHKKPKKLIKTLNRLREEEQKKQARNPGRCIIFFNRIKTLSYIKKHVEENQQNRRVAELHGQMPQFARENALSDFRAGKVHTLLATDIAARGIHINNVAYVVNYDFPGSLEQYIHRCGRAGRSSLSQSKNDRKTESKMPRACIYSFFSREFAPMARDMLELLRQSNSEYIDPNLIQMAEEEKSRRKLDISKKKDRSEGKSYSASTPPKSDGFQPSDRNGDDLDGQFSFLSSRTKIQFKRAEHVSDASSDSDND